MNPAIEELILQIVATSMRVTSQGQWHAFIYLSAHVRTIDVRVRPADTDYQAGTDRPAPVLAMMVSYERDPRWDGPDDDAQLKARQAKLRALHAQLLSYLQPDDQPQEHAA